MSNELYHRSLGALWKAMTRVMGEEVRAEQCEMIFTEMLIELDVRGLAIVEKK